MRISFHLLDYLMAQDPEIKINGDTVSVDLWYPRINPVRKVEVGIMDTRASDSLLVEYDFERNGWSVKQASTFSWPVDDEVCDMDWQEVAFIGSWARKKDEDA